MNKYLIISIISLLVFIFSSINIKASLSENNSACNCLQITDTNKRGECCYINQTRCDRYCLKNFKEGEDRNDCLRTCFFELQYCHPNLENPQ